MTVCRGWKDLGLALAAHCPKRTYGTNTSRLPITYGSCCVLPRLTVWCASLSCAVVQGSGECICVESAAFCGKYSFCGVYWIEHQSGPALSHNVDSLKGRVKEAR